MSGSLFEQCSLGCGQLSEAARREGNISNGRDASVSTDTQGTNKRGSVAARSSISFHFKLGPIWQLTVPKFRKEARGVKTPVFRFCAACYQNKSHLMAFGML